MAETGLPAEDRGLDLLCSESSCVPRAFEDIALLKDERVLSNLLSTENQFLPKETYFTFQPEIKRYMRREVAQWMMEVCREDRCEREVFVLALNYMDRFLSSVSVKKSELQLLGASSLFIASKLKDSHPFTAERLVLYTDYSVNVKDLLGWEHLILQTLNWNISVATPYDFLEPILVRLILPPGHRKKVQNCISACLDFSITELKFSILPPSLLAVVCIQVVVVWLGIPKELGLEPKQILKKLQEITAVDLDLVQTCQEEMEQHLNDRGFAARMNSFERQAPCCVCEEMASVLTPADQAMTPTDLMDIVLVQ